MHGKTIAIASTFIAMLAGCGADQYAPPSHAGSKWDANGPSSSTSSSPISPHEDATVSAPVTPPDPIAELIASDRDERSSLRVRGEALLVTEIQALEALLHATPKSSPDRPLMEQRIAQTYSELAIAAQRRDPKKSGASPQKIAKAAHEAAIREYKAIANEAVLPCRSGTGGVGCLDDVAYHLGLEYERVGRLDDAKLVYLGLVSHYPDSRYLAGVYMGFAELFFNEAAAGKTQWSLAEQAYRAAAKTASGPLRADVHLRLGQSFEQDGDRASARNEYAKLLAEDPTSKAAAFVPAWARGSG